MRCCCDEVTGGLGITLLLMIIKRTICAKPLGCLLFSFHMELMFSAIVLNIFAFNWSYAIKMHSKYCFVFLFKHFLLTMSARIKGTQWCTIWAAKYKRNIRHTLAKWYWRRRLLIPCYIILSVQRMLWRFKMHTKHLTAVCRFGDLLTWLQLWKVEFWASGPPLFKL